MNTLVLVLSMAVAAALPAAARAPNPAPQADQGRAVPEPSRAATIAKPATDLCEPFTHPPAKPHQLADYSFSFDQLEHRYRVPGEFTYRLDGDQYGFQALSFIITDTLPGGGPGLHVHDAEEAHVLLEGTAQYRMGNKTFTVHAPYVVKVPAGVQHTFINAGTQPFKLVAVLASKHPKTTRIGRNPLADAWERRHGLAPCRP
jgi:mannose-6-phosphate isomerase-like protein (cupin superfamily)